MFANKHKPLVCLRQQISNAHRSTAICHLPPRPSINQIKQAHAHIIVSGHAGDSGLMGHLIAFLSVSPTTSFDYCLSLYQTVRCPSVFVFNNMIRCFAKSNSPFESIVLYSYMQRSFVRPNKHTFTFLLQACSKALAIKEGIQVHAHVMRLGFQEDVFIRNALIHFYSACCRFECSKQVFNEDAQWRDIITWNSMLTAYVRDGQISVAVKMFGEMQVKDVISWSTMIMGYVQNGLLEEGLECFKQMRERGTRPNEAILVTILSASAQLGLLGQGRLIHSTIDSLNFPITVPLGTALIDMYAKCGCIELSKLIFNNMPEKDIWSWNVMICGLASHGHAREALALFESFLSEGFCPVNVTFVGVLNACSRAGLVSEGRHYYKLMMENYGIEPEMEHYGCMVDLLARAGCIVEAAKMIETMVLKPDPVLWATLLGACKIHGHVELGEKIGSRLIQLDPTHDGHYVQLAGIYAKARKWDDVIRVRRLMTARSTNKIAGWSLIEVQGRVHRFIAGDREHEYSPEIYKMLEMIGSRIAEAGYSPNISPVLHDIGEEEKENAIKEHSERLAIAFGMLVTEVGDCIRIVKNLRVCEDCHDVSKIISKVFLREIIVRDGSRFHHFKEGKCSCLNYW
ncbi:Pentatricopeptide repeat-containing protein [Quillaja saponaria]|uniref:Pentatricopeptide repeat-containing protein n=1 Tax=Quillaja saponaria TaxID=32244 RepID=A0AAD7LTZ3_QUISA|nr:Pentatricopeptide repeat-containing protein [Quillaja saponaria]